MKTVRMREGVKMVGGRCRERVNENGLREAGLEEGQSWKGIGRRREGKGGGRAQD